MCNTFLLHTSGFYYTRTWLYYTYGNLQWIFITRLQFLLHITYSYYTRIFFFYYTVVIFITQNEHVIMHSWRRVILFTRLPVLSHTITHKGLSKSQMQGAERLWSALKHKEENLLQLMSDEVSLHIEQRESADQAELAYCILLPEFGWMEQSVSWKGSSVCVRHC